jgi:hypothetical protein
LLEKFSEAKNATHINTASQGLSLRLASTAARATLAKLTVLSEKFDGLPYAAIMLFLMAN